MLSRFQGPIEAQFQVTINSLAWSPKKTGRSLFSIRLSNSPWRKRSESEPNKAEVLKSLMMQCGCGTGTTRAVSVKKPIVVNQAAEETSSNWLANIALHAQPQHGGCNILPAFQECFDSFKGAPLARWSIFTQGCLRDESLFYLRGKKGPQLF